MTDASAPPPPLPELPELPVGRFSSREAFQQMVRDALATAARDGWQEIVVSDANFHDWPLGERSVVEALQDWAHGSRRFTMLAGRYDEVVRRHARFVRWRGTWDHIITCRRSPAADPLDIPSALWSPRWVMSGWTRSAARASRASSPTGGCCCARGSTNGCAAKARRAFRHRRWGCEGAVGADGCQDFVKLFLVLASIDGFANIILGCTQKGAKEMLCQCVPGLSRA